MDKYVYLLNKSSEKSAYRKRPIETLKKVEKLKYIAEKQEENEIKQKKAVYNSSNKRRRQISTLQNKVSNKSFKEAVKIGSTNKLNGLLYQKQLLTNSKAPQKDIQEINQKIADEIAFQTRETDLLKEAEEYKNEPLKYLLKLQEIKIEKDASTNKEIKQLKDIFMSKLTPAEKLKFSDEFTNLTPTEQKYITEKLKSVSKRDTKKRNELVEKFLDLEPSQREAIVSEILPNITKPPKGMIQEIDESKPIKKQLIKEIKKSTIAETNFDGDLKMKKFVNDKLMGDNSTSKIEIEKNIEMYKGEYNLRLRKPYDILLENAEDEANENKDKQEAIDETINKSAENTVIDGDMPPLAPIETPEEQRMIEDITEMLKEDGTPEELAKEDAKEAVEGAKAELNNNSPIKNIVEPEPEPKLEPEPEQKQPKKRGRKPKKSKETGKGFTPLNKFPHHLIAGTLAKHIDRVRNKRFKQNMRTLDIYNNTNNKEYAQKLKQHLLSGGGFGDWFFKGLTAPFRLASNIPLPGLQQIGQIGSNIADSLNL